MQLGEILSKAWTIIWKHKVLWIFGLLTGLSSVNTTSSFSQSSEGQQLPSQLENYLTQLPNWQIALSALMVILVVLLLVVLLIFLGTMGRIGLIRGASQADRGAPKLSFGELFQGGLPYFWRVFGLNLLVGFAFALIVILIMIASIPLAISVVGLFCVIPMICLLAPLGFLVNLLIELSNNAIVLERKSIPDGLRRGWQMVSANLGQIILLGGVLLLISWGAGFIIGLPFALFLTPLLGGLLIGTDISMSGGTLITVLLMIAYLPILLLLNGILQGYIRSAWTLAYLRLTARNPILEPNSSPVQ